METARVGDLDIAYERQGDGPPFVLLHGALSDSREWSRQLSGLSDEFTVVAWDAPACGSSSDPAGSFDLADFADCLSGLMAALDLDGAIVLGNSWGGTLAQEFYRRHPGQVRALVLCDTYAGWIGSLGEEAARQRYEACLLEMDRPPEECVPGWIPGLLTQNAPQELADELTSTMLDLHPVGYRLSVETMMTDLRGVLPGIRVPTLLIWGDADARSPLSIARDFEASIPGAKLVVIPGAGHMSHVEQPDHFNAAVRDFCRRIA